MISHKHKCIFVHISKCAGTSIEHAFGVDISNYDAEENDCLYGWDSTNKLWLQHATPQQLLDLKLISKEHWDNYYKIIVYRNSWDRAFSDFKWMKEVRNVEDSFLNYLNKSGDFERILNDDSTSFYAGDHLYSQKKYFFLNGERIKYNAEINFDELDYGLNNVIKDLNLSNNFFNKKLNQTLKNRGNHYSFFYNDKRKKMIEKVYEEDIEFFKFEFVEKKNMLEKMKSLFL
ncbi:sulfotransferase family 2 domain-containing protein [Flavobacterium sp. GSA192]|uniref:sulfotransferase family 2 domain-containing protein n=1 Tax=Flavobacterium sp. GSA192 TaxID=2576304 RepID=UPI00112BB52E|nr:sulfotransferase family 2 domain-containing protein [Flavobacterium sp. GSA192]